MSTTHEAISPFLTQRETLQALGFEPISFADREHNRLHYDGASYERLSDIKQYLPYITLAAGGISVDRFVGDYIEGYNTFRALPLWGPKGLPTDEASASHFTRTQKSQELVQNAHTILKQAMDDPTVRGSAFFRITPTPAWENYVTLQQNGGVRPDDERWQTYTDPDISARITWWSCWQGGNVEL